MYPRNAASPPRIAVGAVVAIADGAVQTSVVSIKVRPEGGTASDGGGPTAYEEGIVLYTPTQAETNYTAFVVIAYKASCLPVAQTVVTTASATAGKVDVSHVAGTAQTARDLGASVLLSPGTGTGQISLTSGAVTAGTVSDKTGYALTTAPPTAGDIATAVWGAGTRTLSSFGTLVADMAVAVWAAATRTLTAAADSSGVTTLLGRLTAIRAGLLDYLDAAVSSRSTYAGGAVASVTGAVGSVTGLTASDVGAIKAKTDNLPASPAVAGEAETAFTSRTTGGAGTEFLGPLLALAPAGGTGLDAAGVRGAIGMASANLDTQLADLPTVAEFAARTAPTTAGAGAEFTAAALALAPAGGTGVSVQDMLDGGIAKEATVLGQFSVTQGIVQSPAISSESKITVTRGDTRTLTLTLGTAWPLTGKKVYFTVKARPEDANAAAIVAAACTITSAASGICTYTPAAGDFATAGEYYYDVEVRNADESSPQTAWIGRLVVMQDVRQ